MLFLIYTTSQCKDSGSYLPCVLHLEEEFEIRSLLSLDI